MKVEFVDLNAQFNEIKKDLSKGLDEVFEKGNFILGKNVIEFENSFSEYCGSKFAVGVNSGTDALFLGLMSLAIGKGDEVIVPAFTFIATALAVSYTGAKVVFADINEKTYNIDVEKVEKAITKKTKAIIPVHLYGQPADMDGILSIAKKYNLKVIEDAAQAHGAEYKGRQTGSMGEIGCFSFYPTKNLGCFGDGGMIVTSDKKIFEKLLMLRDYGRVGRYEHILKGYNSRLDTLQAVVLNEKLKYLDKWNKMRQKNAAIYNNLLKIGKDIKTPFLAEERTHVYHIYGIRIKNRDSVYEQLRNNGIGALIHYPIPLHLQKAYSELGYKKGDFPVAEKVADEIISFPMHPFLKQEEIGYAVKCLLELVSSQ